MRAEPKNDSRAAFGRAVMGPVFAEFALRLWTFLSSLEQPEAAMVLFCARGGLRLRLIYERFLAACHLPPPAATADLMVSRIVAVRVALLAGCPCAYEQIGYELGGGSLRDVARAIGDADAVPASEDAPIWDQAYTRENLALLLRSDEGRALRDSLQRQTELFIEHLQSCLAGRGRAILCDSGLSGSTMQLLEEGLPQLSWTCALFARSNYKRLPTPHFSRTIGLSVQSGGYSPLDVRTAVLRYWHFIEATLEPALPSVSTFRQDGSFVRSNLEVAGWQARIAPEPDDVLAGALEYIDALPGPGAAAQVINDAERAYGQLRRAVVWPTHSDVRVLDTGTRSLDFGRVSLMSGQACEAGIRKALRGSLWREGAVTLNAASLRLPLLAGIEAVYAARWALQLRRQ